MKGLIFTDKQAAEVRDVPRPDPLPGSVIVRIEAAGICGSDLHFYMGRWNRPDYPVGHEFSGEVIDVGEGVEHLKVGDRACAECFSHCGRCTECLTGNYNLCANRTFTGMEGGLTGAFAEFARLPANAAFRMPEALGVDQTVLVEPTAVAHRAACLSGARPDDFALVVGGGTIGLLCAAVLKALIHLRCMIVVKYDQQAEAARALGMDFIHKVTDGRVVDAVAEASAGRMADVAIDTVGSSVSVADAAASVRLAGSVCLVAAGGGRTIMPIGTIVGNELRLVGSSCYGYIGAHRDFDAAIDLIASGALHPEVIITHRFPLDRAPEAFATATDKKTGSIKVLIEM